MRLHCTALTGRDFYPFMWQPCVMHPWIFCFIWHMKIHKSWLGTRLNMEISYSLLQSECGIGFWPQFHDFHHLLELASSYVSSKHYLWACQKFWNKQKSNDESWVCIWFKNLFLIGPYLVVQQLKTETLSMKATICNMKDSFKLMWLFYLQQP